MFRAARRACEKYERSHNPPTQGGALDFLFQRGGGAYYVLDGRGQRDIGTGSFHILGREQFERFATWTAALDPEKTAFLFVVSAVPVLHTRAGLENADRSYALIGVDPMKQAAWFKLYGERKLEPPSLRGARAVALDHSVAKIRLF